MSSDARATSCPHSAFEAEVIADVSFSRFRVLRRVHVVARFFVGRCSWMCTAFQGSLVDSP